MSDKWSARFLDMARLVASWSKDSTQVGAVAVSPARAVLETGYNGIARGVRDLPERMQRPAKYLWTSHAEENLVAHAARQRLEGATVYVTHLCCSRCARMLINAGVARVVCGDGTTNMPPVAVQQFHEAGVDLVLDATRKEASELQAITDRSLHAGDGGWRAAERLAA